MVGAIRPPLPEQQPRQPGVGGHRRPGFGTDPHAATLSWSPAAGDGAVPLVRIVTASCRPYPGAMGRGRPLAALAACLALAVLLGDGAADARTVHRGHGVSALPAVVPGKLIVGFRSGVGPAGRRRALAQPALDGQQPLGSDRVRLVTVAPRASGRARSLLAGDPAGALRRARPRDHGRRARPSLNDPLFGSQWGSRNTGQLVNFTPGTARRRHAARQAWGVTTGSSSVTVGYRRHRHRSTHPDLPATSGPTPARTAPAVARRHRQ